MESERNLAKHGTKGVYFNKEVIARFKKLRGKRFLIPRTDTAGVSYTERYVCPNKVTELARDAIDEFFKILESCEVEEVA